jgi:DNA replication protein DnaC
MIDLTEDATAQLLAHHGHTPEEIAVDSGDPTDLPARVRRNLTTSAAATPARYRSAFPTVLAVRDWATATLRAAKVSPATGAPHVATGPSLLLLGPTGAGKTYEAHGALRLLAAGGANGTVVAVGAADLYADVRPSGGGAEAFDRYAAAGVLFLDDLGAAKPSEWTEEVTYRLINHRYEEMRPTLFTSNVLPSRLGEMLGERVASRLTEMCERVVLDVRDRRLGPAA